MSAQTDLLQAYQEWRHCSLSESDAIGASDWPRLSRSHARKAGLQLQIVRQTKEAEAECDSPAGRSKLRDNLRTILADLLLLESRNSALLAQARGRAQRHREDLNRISSNLRRLQRSYGSPRPAAWTSYS